MIPPTEAPSSVLADSLKIGIPLAFGVIASAITYVLGKRSKHDDIEIKKRHEIAAELSTTFQDLVELYSNLNTTYVANFEHLSPADAAASLERYPQLHEQDRITVDSLNEKRQALGRLIKAGRLYLDPVMLDDMAEYLRTGDFTYSTDGGLFVNTYMEDFYKNLRHTSHLPKRVLLGDTIIRKMRQLARQ